MQYDRDASGKMTPLPSRPSIPAWDGAPDHHPAGQAWVYDTDLLLPIIDRAGELFKKRTGTTIRTNTVLRINGGSRPLHPRF